jgi:aspartyl-tRNA(Asn)/glutamyl-tRNA(Gln) amidotransferase subunit A
MYLEDIFMAAPSLAGLPAISIPCGFAKPDDGNIKMPVGLQLIGSRFNESILFRIGKCFEEKINCHQEKLNL